ncbi:MAG: ABC transporter permease [Pirellulales bacterium]|nr:ABC transporter permease [Pirellulales bacterium]
MNRALLIRTWRDSVFLLLGCCALLFGFIWLRLWIVAQIDFAEAAEWFTRVLPKFFERLLPVSIDKIASIEGRVVFGYEELPVGLLLALWTVSRGSECLAGRLGDGTLEMLLAQPLRRLTLVTSHTGVTLLGVVLVVSSAWLGTATGILTMGFNESTTAITYLPATANLLCIGVLMTGIATLASAVARSRAEAVAMFVGFYVLEITGKILGLMTPDLAWLKKLTFLSAYEPTRLTIGLKSDPAHYWPLFWQYNGILVGLGFASLAIAATIFCRRDVSAPL